MDFNFNFLTDLYANLDIKDIPGNFLDFIKSINFMTNSYWLLLLIIFVILVAAISDYLLSRSFFSSKYRIFVAPGVIVHELSHAFFCLITGAKIEKIALFEKDGGSVTHSKPKLPIIGTFLISMAPLAFGIVLIYFLSRYVGFSDVAVKPFSVNFEDIYSVFKNTISGMKLSDYKSWLLFYLAVSIAITMIPSKQDLKNSFGSLIVLFIVIILLFKYNVLNFDLTLGIDKLSILFTTILFLLILVLLLSIVLYVVTMVFKRR